MKLPNAPESKTYGLTPQEAVAEPSGLAVVPNVLESAANAAATFFKPKKAPNYENWLSSNMIDLQQARQNRKISSADAKVKAFSALERAIAGGGDAVKLKAIVDSYFGDAPKTVMNEGNEQERYDRGVAKSASEVFGIQADVNSPRFGEVKSLMKDYTIQATQLKHTLDEIGLEKERVGLASAQEGYRNAVFTHGNERLKIKLKKTSTAASSILAQSWAVEWQGIQDKYPTGVPIDVKNEWIAGKEANLNTQRSLLLQGADGLLDKDSLDLIESPIRSILDLVKNGDKMSSDLFKSNTDKIVNRSGAMILAQDTETNGSELAKAIGLASLTHFSTAVTDSLVNQKASNFLGNVNLSKRDGKTYAGEGNPEVLAEVLGRVKQGLAAKEGSNLFGTSLEKLHGESIDALKSVIASNAAKEDLDVPSWKNLLTIVNDPMMMDAIQKNVQFSPKTLSRIKENADDFFGQTVVPALNKEINRLSTSPVAFFGKAPALPADKVKDLFYISWDGDKVVIKLDKAIGIDDITLSGRRIPGVSPRASAGDIVSALSPSEGPPPPSKEPLSGNLKALEGKLNAKIAPQLTSYIKMIGLTEGSTDYKSQYDLVGTMFKNAFGFRVEGLEEPEATKPE